MDKELLIELDKVLVECRDDGSICMTKDTNGLTRRAINEAVARGWLYKYNSYSYKLDSSGIDVLDFGTVEEFLSDKKSKRDTITPPTTLINAKNVVYGDTVGEINQSSKNQTNNLTSNANKYKTAQTKPKISILEWVGIILGIIVSIIVIYQFLIGD
jgi:hypothetical protein